MSSRYWHFGWLPPSLFLLLFRTKNKFWIKSFIICASIISILFFFLTFYLECSRIIFFFFDFVDIFHCYFQLWILLLFSLSFFVPLVSVILSFRSNRMQLNLFFSWVRHFLFCFRDIIFFCYIFNRLSLFFLFLIFSSFYAEDSITDNLLQFFFFLLFC